MARIPSLKSLDAFPHAEEHLLKKTLALLRFYLTAYTVHQMSVDLKRGETLPIHINMPFPSLPCEVLSVDAIDMSGKHEVDLHTNIWKVMIMNYIFCCCQFARVYGVLDVQRVAGNFHISVHGLNIFVAEKIFEGSSNVNASHVIHDLSFGPKYPGIHNPLDETSRILHSTSGTFKYYIKVVPTEYRYLSKKVLPTNQFSVTEYFLPIRPTDRSWPAVYFLYDLSPITVTIKEERRNFLHFLTRLCAILGGTFAMTGMLDRWMYLLIESVTNSKTRSVLR
ncbi:endoplasmic reticulum-Golgi intermediate compartment protein 3 [Panicum miliaceum]|uniref:Endoplasmic reticulum-Golgi intermediate compartment protein 3 n=1 Tax=Panicum miliaceum TaxID=4540 RepID=A0A3L6S4V6_PANMI|nr:endoplasmic reticulum-Golgi intermediate compartment protein 3 [Panicum miliaceum]